MRQLARLFFALWYLGGCAVHVYNGLTNGHMYSIFGDTWLLPFGHAFWTGVVMPNIAVFTLLLAAFEVTTGVLILSKGRYVRLGLVASILFNLYLVQQGLGSPQPDLLSDFLMNRAVNLIFAALQVPLLRVRYDETILEAAWHRVRRVRPIAA